MGESLLDGHERAARGLQKISRFYELIFNINTARPSGEKIIFSTAEVLTKFLNRFCDNVSFQRLKNGQRILMGDRQVLGLPIIRLPVRESAPRIQKLARSPRSLCWRVEPLRWSLWSFASTSKLILKRCIKIRYEVPAVY
jgi:hypothetical protein